MGLNWAEHSIEIAAPIETSFDAIVDYESFPRWQDAVESVEVLSRTKAGLGEDVRLFVDAKVRKIDYVLRYRYERPTEIRWDFVEGNGMRDLDGTYTLESLGPDRTRATYNLGADPAIPVPGMVLRRTHKALVKRSVEDLKREAERRHAAGEGAQAPATEAKPRSFRLSRRKRDTDGEPPSGPGREWAPKAQREAAAGTPHEGPESAEEPGLAAVSDLPAALLRGARKVATDPVTGSRELVESGLRAARSVARLALEVGVDVAERIDRRLSGEDEPPDERRDDEGRGWFR
jgi:ribosome-associated toxin RatA of RatAB toxin-antitoxin module